MQARYRRRLTETTQAAPAQLPDCLVDACILMDGSDAAGGSWAAQLAVAEAVARAIRRPESHIAVKQVGRWVACMHMCKCALHVRVQVLGWRQVGGQVELGVAKEDAGTYRATSGLGQWPQEQWPAVVGPGSHGLCLLPPGAFQGPKATGPVPAGQGRATSFQAPQRATPLPCLPCAVC